MITKDRVRQTSDRLNRKIHLLITAVGTGSIVDTIQKELPDLKSYIGKITLSDLRDIDLSRWPAFEENGISLGKQIGNITDIDFLETLKADMIYGNELFGDLPIRFVSKQKSRLYDIWLRAYTKDPLHHTISGFLKNLIKKVEKEADFPKGFTPELGKILRFDIAFRNRIRNRGMETIHELYPDSCIFAVTEYANDILLALYENLPEDGCLLFHDYGFFSQENLHLIKNFLRPDNDNLFVRNYYGEFTTDPAFDYVYTKLRNKFTDFNIKKTTDLLHEITGIPSPLINLDGPQRDASFFIKMLKERFQVWETKFDEKFALVIEKYIQDIKSGSTDVEAVVNSVCGYLEDEMWPARKQTINKILSGYFNDDDHRFLTLEIIR